MIKIAKHVGLMILAIVFLAIPALAVLSIIFSWSPLLIFLFAGMVIIEIFLIMFALESLTDEGIL